MLATSMAESRGSAAAARGVAEAVCGPAEAVPELAPSQKRPRLITPAFIAVSLSSLVYFIAEGVTLPVIPRYVSGPLGGGSVAVGVTMGAFSVSALFLRPWAGRFGDRRGRRILMLLGGTFVAVSFLGYAAAPNVAAMVALRLLTGVGEAMYFVGSDTAIIDLAPEERRGEAISFFSLSLYAGIGLGPVLGEWALQTFGFTAAWITGAAAAMVAVVVATQVPETRPDMEPPAGRGRLVHPAGVLPGLVLVSAVLGMAGFFAFLPLYGPSVGLPRVDLIFVLLSGIVIAVRLFGARLPDVLGPRRAATGSLTLVAAGLSVLGLWRSTAGVVAGTAVFALGISLAFPALLSMAVKDVPASERGAVVGTFSASVDLAFGFGPMALGVVAALAGHAGTFLASAVVAGAGLLLLAWTRPGRARAATTG